MMVTGPVAQEGWNNSGVSLAFTVLAMDAGPIVAQETVDMHRYKDANDALQDLFQIGARCVQPPPPPPHLRAFPPHLPSGVKDTAGRCSGCWKQMRLCRTCTACLHV